MRKTGTSLSTPPDIGVGELFEEREYRSSQQFAKLNVLSNQGVLL